MGHRYTNKTLFCNNAGSCKKANLAHDSRDLKAPHGRRNEFFYSSCVLCSVTNDPKPSLRPCGAFRATSANLFEISTFFR